MLYLQPAENRELGAFLSAYPTLNVDQATFEFRDNPARKLHDNLVVICCSLPKVTCIFIVCLHITYQMIAIEVERVWLELES